MKSENINYELSLISEPNLRQIVTDFFEIRVPDYFFVCPASSTGKHHPQISQGQGGLVRHTKAVVMIAEDLLKLDMWSQLLPKKDMIISACLIHDTFKLGDPQEKYTKHEHPQLAGEKFKEFTELYQYSEEKIDEICKMVSSHMGQWNTNTHSNVILPKPATPQEKFVHMCDFIASRSFIGSLNN